jgi:hypothetical protein
MPSRRVAGLSFSSAHNPFNINKKINPIAIIFRYIAYSLMWFAGGKHRLSEAKPKAWQTP